MEVCAPPPCCAAAGNALSQAAAIAKSQANEHQGAIDLYLQAYAIVPLPVLLSNIGAEYQLITKPVEALKYFCKYLEADRYPFHSPSEPRVLCKIRPERILHMAPEDAVLQ